MAEQKTLTQVVGSSIADWVKDPATGKERTPQEIIAAVTEAVLKEPNLARGVSLDPLTGKPRPSTDQQMVDAALAQLAANAKFEGPRLESAKAVSKALGKGSAASSALANRPDLWAVAQENVGKVIDRKIFDDPRSVQRFVVDPTKNQLTPEQLKQYQEIGASGGMAIDPVSGAAILIDKQGRYTLGEQPSGDVTGLNYATGERYGMPGTGGTSGGTGGSIGGGTGGGTGTGGAGSGNPDTLTAGDGRQFDNFSDYLTYQDSLDEKKANRKSAYDLLYSEFKNYGLEALVSPLKSLIEEGVSPSEFSLRLRETDAYKKRFAANAQRVAKGLRALSEAEYISTEDQYQDVMRRYGMPESYYAKGDLGVQSGFEKFLAGDVSAVELEDRIQTANNRVVNSNPEVAKALKEFYPGISNGDILAYVLDPTNAIENIKRKVTAAEIGGAAIQSGLKTGITRAEELGAAGITKAQAQQGFGTIAGGLTRGSQLASIYGEDAYNQTTAEQEVFGLAGAQDAAKQRKKITGLEKATFGGQTGVSSTALARDRAGAY
jgi:hypothetical protein